VQDVLRFTDDAEEASDTGGGETGKAFAKIIQHIIMLCSFLEDPVMVEVIKQQTELEHVTTITFDEVKDLCLLRDDGVYLGCPMMVHIPMLKAILHYIISAEVVVVRFRTMKMTCWNTRNSSSTSIVVGIYIPKM
jgi:hypothetical protein